MQIIRLTLLLFLTKLCSSQNILSLMAKEKNISTFYNIIISNPSILTTFDRPNLVVLAPNNTAISSTPVKPLDFINKHLFESVANYKSTLGTIAAWSSYTGVTTRTEIVRYIQSFQFNPLYFTNLTVGPPMINGAQVTDQDKTSGTQVYHVIDRVIPDSYMMEFLLLISNSPISATLTQSNEKWQKVLSAYKFSQFKNTTNFRPEFLTFSNTAPGTILIPTNDAWNSLSADDLQRLNNPDELIKVMARFYIPNRVMFLHDQPLSFRAGFSSNPAIDDNFNIDGKYFRSSQSDMIDVEGYVATVITKNIAFNGGVIHIIGDSMSIKETKSAYLQRWAPAFYAAVIADTDLMSALNGNNVTTLLAVDERTMAELNKMDPATRKRLLMNCFLPGVITLANSNDVYLDIAGNLTIRVKTVGNRIFIDTLSSLPEKTFVNRAWISSSGGTVQGSNVYIMVGTIGDVKMNCTDMFTLLDRRYYQTLINNLGVTLGLGSPYTLFVPSNESLAQLIQQTNITVTTTTTTLASVSSPPNNASISSTSSTTSSSSINSNTAVPGKSTNTMLRYLLQRMIVANRLVLNLRSAGQFKAATMNYAAMQEMIDISIALNLAVSIGINGVMIAGPAMDEGFYCYSNDPVLGDRRNLIYPINAVLVSAKDSSISICVTAPCAGCVVTYAGSLLLAVLCVLYQAHN